MASDKIYGSEEIRKLLRQMHPNQRQSVGGVLSRLEDDVWRDATKIDFGTADGDQLWGIVDNLANIVFIEEADGQISVVHVSGRSRFRPAY